MVLHLDCSHPRIHGPFARGVIRMHVAGRDDRLHFVEPLHIIYDPVECRVCVLILQIADVLAHVSTVLYRDSDGVLEVSPGSYDRLVDTGNTEWQRSISASSPD